MKQVEINLKAAAFPDEFASDAQKDTAEYGLQVGQAIQYEWFRKDNGYTHVVSSLYKSIKMKLLLMAIYPTLI